MSKSIKASNSNIVLLPLNKLFPHPNNPRKDIGDISELTESIRTDGILQNLTVVKGGPGVPEGADGYTVIIGHRRKAAADAAGLTEAPCTIIDMDEKKQISTMLVENMAREDLTVYEQAQSFQMMIDLGETQESIAKMTGFSQGTVRNRLRLTKLDKEKFEKSQDKNISLEEYLRVSDIEDSSERDRLMDIIGTRDFSWQLNSSIKHQNEKKYQAIMQKKIDELGIAPSEDQYIRYSNAWETIQLIPLDENIASQEIDLKGEDPKNVRYVLSFNDCGFYRKAKKPKADPTPKYIRDFEKERDRIQEELIERYAFAHTQRVEFMKNLPLNKGMDIMLKAMSKSIILNRYIYPDRELANEIFDTSNIKAADQPAAFSEWVASSNINWPAMSVLLALGDCKNLCCIRTYNSAEPIFVSNELSNTSSFRLKEIYDLLESLGYTKSEEEQQLMDGTHPLFEEFLKVKAEFEAKKPKIAS